MTVLTHTALPPSPEGAQKASCNCFTVGFVEHDLVWVRYSVRPAPERHREGVELEAGLSSSRDSTHRPLPPKGLAPPGKGFLQAPGAHVEEEHAAGVTFFF